MNNQRLSTSYSPILYTQTVLFTLHTHHLFNPRRTCAVRGTYFVCVCIVCLSSGGITCFYRLFSIVDSLKTFRFKVMASFTYLKLTAICTAVAITYGFYFDGISYADCFKTSGTLSTSK